MRVHELAKELGLSSKEIIDRLVQGGISVKNHMSAIDDTAIALVRQPAKASDPATVKPAPAKVAVKATPREQPKAAAVHVPVRQPAPAPVPPPPAARAKELQKPVPARTPAPKAAPAAMPTAPVDEKHAAFRGAIIVKELAERLNLRPNNVISELMAMNIFASISDRVDVKIAQKIASKHGITLEIEKRGIEHKPAQKAWEETEEQPDKPEDLEARPPIVTFLGHVDHGKTSLLDKIRKTMVAKGEAGGITQHIGAYTVEVHGRKITFLDTPGHEAFTAMRARGANLTDIAVIIVAADDGVMPQTIEAIQHAKAANACIMVAINKSDLPTASPDRVKKQLQTHGLTPEDWGGTTVCCEVSAVTGTGIDHLLEMILLQADMLDLKASKKRRAEGFIIEAQLEPGMGPTANVLIKRGCLKVGDVILCGQHWGKVKAIINDHGIRVRTAEPSTPVKCLGLSGVPEAGAQIKVCTNERVARTLAEEQQTELRTRQAYVPKKVSLDNLYDHLKSTHQHELKIVLKADVNGSLEAIKHALGGIKSEKATLKIVLSGVGNITVNDTLLASASDAIVVGFNVPKESGVGSVAKAEGVEIRLHSIIYDLVDEIRASMAGLLEPQIKETVIGHAKVQEVFQISKLGNIAGCILSSGRATSKSRARVIRKGDVIFQGSVSGLRRFQNDASEVREGQECGVRLDNFQAFEAGDTIDFYEVTKIAQTL